MYILKTNPQSTELLLWGIPSLTGVANLDEVCGVTAEVEAAPEALRLRLSDREMSDWPTASVWSTPLLAV